MSAQRYMTLCWWPTGPAISVHTPQASSQLWIMAPVFSRARTAVRTRPIPADIIIEIGSYLHRTEKRSMILCCWNFHDILVPSLYRHVDVWFQPPSWEESEGYEAQPYRLLSTLARSARYCDTPGSTRCYARYVVTFRYLSHSLRADLRAVPLFTEFLRFAVRLRHLAVDICKTAVPFMVEYFRRNGVIRSPPAPLVATCIAPDSAQPWILPALDSIRSPKAPIVVALMRFRCIRSAIIDNLPGAADMESLVGLSSQVFGSRLVRLCVNLPTHIQSCCGTFWAIMIAFPALTFLSLRTSSRIAGEFFDQALDLIAAHRSMLPFLQSFGVNHTLAVDRDTSLEDLTRSISALGQDREALDTLSCGDALWHRHGPYGTWELTTHFNFSSRSTAPSSRLSAIELFLLGSEASIVETFFAHWTPDVIFRLRQLSSSMRLATEAYCARRWDVNAFLGRWFHFVPTFLKVLDDCGGVVSGSEAQQFFDRESYRGRDLDVYVPLHGLLRMGRWIKEQGFLYHATADRHPLFDVAAVMFTSYVGVGAISLPSQFPTKPSTFAAFNFARPLHHSMPEWLKGMHIQLIAVPCNPVEFIVNNFHSTGVMNYMTGQYAVSLFPRTTFVDRTSLVCQDITRNAHSHRLWMKKYRKRGFNIIGAGDALPCTFELRNWQRNVGDSLTWVLPFERQVLIEDRTTRHDCHQYAFEVLPYFYEVAPAGAAIRVGPRFVFSSIAVLANPAIQLGDYRSLELSAAFADYAGSDDDFYASTDSDDMED
ncbi:hypothetical protein ACG7TL_004472 [Trametes sanguinea]